MLFAAYLYIIEERTPVSDVHIDHRPKAGEQGEPEMKIQELFDLTHTAAAPLLEPLTFPWEALDGIGAFLETLIPTLGEDYLAVGENVRIHKTAVVHPSADITGPCVIGARTVLRPGAFLRGNVLIGEDCVIGNSCEVKNCIVFDSVQLPHFNYAGDSIFGYRSHMGAGAVTSNVKSDRLSVVVRDGDIRRETGRKKVGAFLGDLVEIGCGSVLNPGTVIGRGSRVYPLTSVRGVIPADSIVKAADRIVPIRKENGKET